MFASNCVCNLIQHWIIRLLLSQFECFVSAYSGCIDLREVRDAEEAESERRRSRRDICGDNGLMILIFTYLLV